MTKNKLLLVAILMAILVPLSVAAWAGNGKGSGGQQGIRQSVYQSTILQLVAVKLDVDYDAFLLEYNTAKAAALAYANTTSARPINMQAKLFEYLASALNLPLIDVELAFSEAKAKVFGP